MDICFCPHGNKVATLTLNRMEVNELNSMMSWVKRNMEETIVITRFAENLIKTRSHFEQIDQGHYAAAEMSAPAPPEMEIEAESVNIMDFGDDDEMDDDDYYEDEDEDGEY